MTTPTHSTKLWIPIYVADYLADTSRLTTEQHGAYLLLIFDYWRNGPLPDDDAILSQVCRLAPDAWSMHRAVLRSFFSKGEDGSLRQKRIDAEMEKAQLNRSAAVSKAKRAAEARWGTHAPSMALSNAPELLEECPSPSPSPTKTIQNPSGLSVFPSKTAKNPIARVQHNPLDVERIRIAYPLKKAPGEARRAIGKALDRLVARGEAQPVEFLLERIAAWLAVRERDGLAGRFVPTCPYPSTFFNQDRFDEEGLQPLKNCVLPDGSMGTAEELKRQADGWKVIA